MGDQVSRRRRKKSERELLDAYVCPDCQTFYDAMMPGKDRSTIKCTRAAARECDRNSRHRAKWARNRREGFESRLYAK